MSLNDLVPAEVPADVAQQAELQLGHVAGLEVLDQTGLDVATTVLAGLQKAYKQTEAARVALVKPLNDHVSFVNATFRPKLDALKGAQLGVRQKVAAYQERVAAEAQAAAREEQRAQEALAELLGTKDVAPVAAPVVKVESHQSAASLGVSKVWTYELASMQELCAAIGRGEAPTGLVELNRSAVRGLMNAKIKSDGRPPAFPGIEFKQETQVAVRSNG
jgi:hypothetical protein